MGITQHEIHRNLRYERTKQTLKNHLITINQKAQEMEGNNSKSLFSISE